MGNRRDKATLGWATGGDEVSWYICLRLSLSFKIEVRWIRARIYMPFDRSSRLLSKYIANLKKFDYPFNIKIEQDSRYILDL